MSQKVEKGRIGQSFDDFLREERRYEESTAQAIKRVLAYQLATAMEDQHITKAALAKNYRPAVPNWIDYLIQKRPVSRWKH